ncbi:hypothetical protein BH23PSE2_BH23PSE2_08800 [soil metagenome]
MTAQPLEDVHTTRWSLIHELDAGNADSRSQFNALCLRYWAPVHQYILGHGHHEAHARQLTQRFFTLLQAEGLSRATGYTRFRDFLASELGAFLSACGEQPDEAFLPPLSPVAGAPAPAISAPPPGDAVPVAGTSLERNLALEVVAQSMARLRKEAADAGHRGMFERLQRYLSVEPHGDELQREAEALEATQLFVSLAIRRLRQRFRSIVDDELTQLVTDPTQLADERNAMFAALERVG